MQLTGHPGSLKYQTFKNIYETCNKIGKYDYMTHIPGKKKKQKQTGAQDRTRKTYIEFKGKSLQNRYYNHIQITKRSHA